MVQFAVFQASLRVQPYFPHAFAGPRSAALVNLIADPGIMSWIPARPHTFVEIVHELLSTAILSRRAVVSYKLKYMH